MMSSNRAVIMFNPDCNISYLFALICFGGSTACSGSFGQELSDECICVLLRSAEDRITLEISYVDCDSQNCVGSCVDLQALCTFTTRC